MKEEYRRDTEGGTKIMHEDMAVFKIRTTALSDAEIYRKRIATSPRCEPLGFDSIWALSIISTTTRCARRAAIPAIYRRPHE